MNQKQLIEKCLNGDRFAQKRMYDLFSVRMIRLCERYLKDTADAEDAFITAFRKAFEKLPDFEYRGEESLGRWLSTIVVNECLATLRKNNGMEKVETIDEQFPQHTDAYSDEAFIYSLILELPTGYRTVFNLHVIEGYTHKEISEMLDISEGTSKSQLSKARSYLKGRLVQNNLRYGNGRI